jgi:large subunit ribosomal protein L13
LRDLLATHPERVIEKAVWGMLPHNRMGRSLMRKIRIYASADHPHAAQNPKPIEEVLPQ